MTALAKQPEIKARILAHVAQGGRLVDLGLPISPQAISKALKDDPDYQDATLAYHQARLDKAEQMIEDAVEQVDVARARALHDAYKWRAGKERRQEYGDRTEIDLTTGISMDQALGQSALALLDRIRTVATQDKAESGEE